MTPQFPLGGELKSLLFAVLIVFAIIQTMRRRPAAGAPSRDDALQHILFGVTFSLVGLALTIATFVIDGRREAYVISVAACVLGAVYAGHTWRASRR